MLSIKSPLCQSTPDRGNRSAVLSNDSITVDPTWVDDTESLPEISQPQQPEEPPFVPTRYRQPNEPIYGNIPADPSQNARYNDSVGTIYEEVTGDDDEEELASVLLEVEELAKQIDDDEKAAIQEFVAARKKGKGGEEEENMKRIKPRKANILKAAIKKAYALNKKLKEKRLAKDEGRFVGTIADFVPKNSTVPHILAECIMNLDAAVDCRKAGLYRKGGDPMVVRKLKKRFLRGKIPNLENVDQHDLAATILSFLNDLAEPLIPPHMWDDFVVVGQIDDLNERVEQLKELFLHLPIANRDSLAAILGHLRTIDSPLMPRANYARLFGPILIGYSCPENEETERVLLVETMYGLLSIPGTFFYSFDSHN